MQKAALIYNPLAGDGQFKQHIEQVKDRFNEKGIQLDLFETKHRGHGKELAQQCGEKYELIVAAGGDGTIHEIINGICLLEVKPPFGIIPAGTANDFCRALHIPIDLDGACDVILAGGKQNVDVGRLNQEHYFLNFWGIGLITDISNNVKQNEKSVFGRLAYYVSTVQKLNDIPSFQCEIIADQYSYKGDAVMVIVANGPSIGGLQLLFPHAKPNDGSLNLLLCKAASLNQIASIIESKVTGEPIDHESIVYIEAKKITINTNQSMLIDCDGEKSYYTPCIIEVLPKFLTVFTPLH